MVDLGPHLMGVLGSHGRLRLTGLVLGALLGLILLPVPILAGLGLLLVRTILG
jgi:hypothetical protein